MDPVGITASLLTILQTIYAGAEILYDGKRATEEREIFKVELQGLNSVIKALQRRQEDSQAAGSQELDDLFQTAGELNQKFKYKGPKNGKPNGDMALVYQTVAELDRKLCPKEQPKVWKRVAQKVTHHWRKNEFKGMLEGLGRARGRIQFLLNEADQVQHRETQSTIRRIEKQQEDQRRLLEEAEREAEKTAIQKWLSPFSFRTRQDELCKDRCMTGDWFLKEETFQSWVLGPPRYLYCFGEAGAGKVCTWAQLRRIFASDKPTL